MFVFVVTLYVTCISNVTFSFPFAGMMETATAWFSAIKRALGGKAQRGYREDPFYPTCYFRCQVMAWMVQNRQLGVV